MSDSTAWREVYADLRKILESSMKGSIANKLEVIAEIIYAYGCETLGVIEIKSKEGKQKKEGKGK